MISKKKKCLLALGLGPALLALMVLLGNSKVKLKPSPDSSAWSAAAGLMERSAGATPV